jgi:hypothetical protein
LVKVVLALIVPHLKGKRAYAEFKIKSGIDGITDAVLVSSRQLEAMRLEIFKDFRKKITM